MKWFRKRVFFLLFTVFFFSFQTFAENSPWEKVLKNARGKEVFFYAWGGSPKVNNYLSWVGERIQEEYGVTLKHVKLTDTALAVSQVLAEKTAKNDNNGLIDLVWINGENFRTMKEANLLSQAFLKNSIPNLNYISFDSNAAFVRDFNIPTEGFELPWGVSKLVFVYEPANTLQVPKSLSEMLRYAKKHPNRVTYPQPPDFTGSSFLKQLLYELIEDRTLLLEEPSQAVFEKQTAPMWKILEESLPYFWNKGKVYPANEAELLNLFSEGEIDFYFTFAPLSIELDIKNENLPDTVQVFVPEIGSIGNAHFVAIPYNTPRKDAALVLANFLASPEAQAKKQSLTFWGDFTVLDYASLPAKEKSFFDKIEKETSHVKINNLGKTLAEPHPAWMEMIEAKWKKTIGNR